LIKEACHDKRKENPQMPATETDWEKGSTKAKWLAWEPHNPNGPFKEEIYSKSTFAAG
jgi:hypothetical protein